MDGKTSGSNACTGTDMEAAKNGGIVRNGQTTTDPSQPQPPPHHEKRSNHKALAEEEEEKKGEEQPLEHTLEVAASIGKNGMHSVSANQHKSTTTNNNNTADCSNGRETVNGEPACSKRHDNSEHSNGSSDNTIIQNDRLAEARRKLFHQQAYVLHAGSASQQEDAAASLLQVPASLEAASHGGRDCWNPANEENGTTTISSSNNKRRKKRKLSDVATLLVDFEDRQSKPSSTLEAATLTNTATTKPKSRRKQFRSTSLEQLEQKLTSKYREKLFEQRQHNEENSNTTTVGNVKSLTLKFNECSIACLSKWITSQLKSGSRGAALSAAATEHNNNKSYRVAVQSRFRICSICNQIGHYELECPEQTAQQTQKLVSVASKRKRTTQPPQPTSLFDNQNPPPWNHVTHCNPGEAVVEMLGGFLFEQSAEPFTDVASSAASATTSAPHPPHGTRNRNDEDSTEIDGFTIRATKDGPIPGPVQTSSLQVDDLVCWSSRGGAGTLLVGVVVTPQDGESGASATAVATTTLPVRCIAALAPESGAVEDKDSRKIGTRFAIRRTRLMRVDDALMTTNVATAASPAALTVARNVKDPPPQPLSRQMRTRFQSDTRR